MHPTIAQIVVRMLADAGVRRGYTVPGESFLELLDAFDSEPALELISTRHEGGASFMAEADGKLHGTPAVVMGSRGPGATNLSIGVHTAQQDETPMLVLIGQVESAMLGRESFQEVDLAGLFRPLAKWAAQAETAEDVPALLAEALRDTRGGRPGPAVLAVPTDFWAVPYERPIPGPAPIEPIPHPHSGQETASLLAEADSPVVITGCREPETRAELVATAESMGLGVYTAFRRQDAFPEDHRNYLGHLGLGVPDDQLDALLAAEVVVVLGTRLDEATSQGFRFPLPEQRTVRVGSNAAAFLREVRRSGVARVRDWSKSNAAVHRFMALPDTRPADGLHPAEVIDILRGLVPADTIVTNDAGNFSGFLHRHWCFTEPTTLLGPCNGAMGYAVPAAVAAKVAYPGRTVLAMVGDGGALMTGQEMETAVRLNAPVVTIVFGNGLYGTIAMHQAKKNGRLSAVSIGTVDFASWARGLGAVGYTVRTAEELTTAAIEALAQQRPAVLDIRTDPDVLTSDTRLSELTGKP